jgi:hypothetical protein
MRGRYANVIAKTARPARTHPPCPRPADPAAARAACCLREHPAGCWEMRVALRWNWRSGSFGRGGDTVDVADARPRTALSRADRDHGYGRRARRLWVGRRLQPEYDRVVRRSAEGARWASGRCRQGQGVQDRRRPVVGGGRGRGGLGRQPRGWQASAHLPVGRAPGSSITPGSPGHLGQRVAFASTSDPGARRRASRSAPHIRSPSRSPMATCGRLTTSTTRSRASTRVPTR